MTRLQRYAQKPSQLRSVPVSHWRNLGWWALLLGIVIGIHEVPGFMAEAYPPQFVIPWKEKNAEKEAFIALVFGKVSTTHELAISASKFEAQLKAMKDAGYSTVRLDQILSWRQADTVSLPPKPVLLTFEEANRETMEIADKVLASLGMTALVFVNVDLLDEGDIHLVSWHYLELLARSGRWEIGISGCPVSDDPAFASSVQLAQRLHRQRERLEKRLKVPVTTADCAHAWNSASYPDGAAVWAQALKDADLQVGFVAAPFGANYRNDPEAGLRRIRFSRIWDKENFLGRLENHAPRRASFSDQFQSERSAWTWVVDIGEIALEEDSLRIYNDSGEKGALLTLSGTEKWQDGDVEVRLKGQPQGQFWIALRYRTGQPAVRLGIAEGRILLQRSDVRGVHRQLARRNLPSGDITLRLRIVGTQVNAYVNGQAMLPRPAMVPKGADYGPVSLALWNKDGVAGRTAAGETSVHLHQVSATPLFPKCGIIAPKPGEGAWKQLQRRAEELSMISPSYFAWIDGKPLISKPNTMTTAIFARFHRLKILPALFVDPGTSLSDTTKLREQALLWANNSTYDGLNIVLTTEMAENEWRPFLNDLNWRLSKIGKTLTVTLIDDQQQPMHLAGKDGLLLVGTHADLLPEAPKLLYPLYKETML